MLPKVHKRLYDVRRRPVISNCGFYIKNSAFRISFRAFSPEGKVISKDTTQFLRKIILFGGYMLTIYFLFGNMVKNR